MFSRLLQVTSYSLLVIVLLSGCVVRTYPLTRERVDQDLSSGNKGYLKGQSPTAETTEKKTTRITQVVEIELRSPIRFEKMAKHTEQPQSTQQATGDKTTFEGNKGYITNSVSPEMAEQVTKATFEKYTVGKGDTLQKISQKFYNTTKKWLKIYEANKDVLKGPNKVYPGQVLMIPSVPLEGPKENLK